MERAELEAPIPDAEAKPLGLSRFLDGSFAASAQISSLHLSIRPLLYPFREFPKKGAGLYEASSGIRVGATAANGGGQVGSFKISKRAS